MYTELFPETERPAVVQSGRSPNFMPTKPKHKSKGKRHPLHAETLDNLAIECEKLAQFTMATIFRNEAKRVRTILR